MSNYVTKMSKESGGTFDVMDKEARAAISAEESARQAAISAEATARNEQFGGLRTALDVDFLHSEKADSHALTSLFSGKEDSIFSVNGNSPSASPHLSQLLHKFTIVHTQFISRIEIYKYIHVDCSITIALYCGDPKYGSLIASETHNLQTAQSNAIISLSVNNILVSEIPYYLTIQADKDNAFDYMAALQTSDELVQYGSYWLLYGTDTVDLKQTYTQGNWNGNIGFTGKVYKREQANSYYNMRSALENAPLGEVLPFMYKTTAVVDNTDNISDVVFDWYSPFKKESAGDHITPRTKMIPTSGYFTCVVRCECEDGVTFGLWRDDLYNDNTDRTYIRDRVLPTNQDVEITIDLNYYAVYENCKAIGFFFAAHAGDTVRTITIKFVKPPQWTQYKGISSFGDLLGEWLNNLSAGNEPVESVSSRMKDIAIAPNMVRYAKQIDNNCDDVFVPVIPRKAMFIGNSLLHGFSGFGMAASSSSKDYVAFFRAKVNESLSNPITIYRIPGGGWEGQTTIEGQNTWLENNLPANQLSECDLIVVQLGDNVNTDDKRAVFPDGARNFLAYLRENAPQAKVCWMGSWYSQNLMQYAEKACEETGGKFIDIRPLNTIENQSHLGAISDRGEGETYTYSVSNYTVNPNNTITFQFVVNGTTYTATVDYTSYSYDDGNLTITGGKYVVTNPGVASHPGDRGFKAIANKMLYDLCIVDDEEYYDLDN